MTDLTKININKLSISVFYDSRSRSSFCWKYFGNLIYYEGHKRKILFPEQVYCAACLNTVQAESKDINFGSVKVKKYLRTVSTGNLSRHLREDHQIREEKASDDEGKNVGRSNKASGSARYDKWLLARDVALWFCRSLLPFDSISDEGMIDFFQKYNISATKELLPSRFVVSSSALTDVYEDMLFNVQEKICTDAAQTFAMAFDLWTDQYRQLTYITFTLHYLTSEFELKALTLSTKIITRSETEEQIIDVIENVRKQFKLENKIMHAVCDAGGSVRRAVLLANMAHHLCLGNGLHNLVNVDGIKSVPEVAAVVKKCKKIVMALRYRVSDLEAVTTMEQRVLLSSIDKVAEMLQSDETDSITQGAELSIKCEKPEPEDASITTSTSKETNDIPTVKTDTPSRWHCLLEMLETLIQVSNREPLDNMLKKIGRNELRFTQSEWSLLEDLFDFLKRFREVVEILSSQSTCTMNVALVFRSEIIDILNSVLDEESLVMFRLKRNMLANIDKRFPVTRAMVAAALLDYRFMSLNEVNSYLKAHGLNRASFLAAYVKEYIKVDNITTIKLEVEDPLGNASGSHDTPTILQKLSRKHSLGSSPGMQDDPVEQECWRYLASADPTEPKDGNLFAFWNSKKITFPWLSAFARSLLCVPATSTPSERVFSEAGLILSAKRLRLNPARVNKIIFIHDNYKMCNLSKEK